MMFTYTCSKCGKKFKSEKTVKDWCKQCHNNASKLYGKKRRERMKADQNYKEEYNKKKKTWSRNYYIRHRDRLLEEQSQYINENREKRKETVKKSRQRMKALVVSEYGGKCSCCGETHIEFLTIEHSRNDGKEKRKGETTKTRNVYSDLIKRGFPKDEGIEIHCMNCNFAKALYGYCPHNNLDLNTL